MKRLVLDLTDDEIEILVDAFEYYDDCGPEGEGWQSDKLILFNKKLREAIEKGTPI